MPIVITGASGFIGRALCQNLSQYDNVLGVDIKKGNFDNKNVKWKIADLTDFNIVSDLFKKHISDVIIHCAGIAHQKMGAVESSTYMRVNSDD
jgi:nucleoside-diphosphate-sugar epimerase